MALKPGFLLLLWLSALCFHGVMSFCNVTCSTDYNISLNCSCSGSVLTHSVFIHVRCSDGEFEAVDACEVKPPQSWCMMYPAVLSDVASIGTTCTGKATQQGDQVIENVSESSSWELSDVVKPPPPSDVQVKDTDGFYNITWNHNNLIDCLTFTVRIRESKDFSKDPILSFSLEEKKHFLLNHMKLQPHVNYTVDVMARMCPENLYLGPWSEWSSSAQWRTTGPSEIKGLNLRFFYGSSFIIIFVLLMFLALKPYLAKKIQMITYIPKADEFFKPLYQNYGGNFKEWVKPVFSEYDHLRVSSQLPINIEKQHDVLQWNNEKQVYMESTEMNENGQFLHMLQPHSNSLLFFQNGGRSQGTSHSTGHISIHTVTLSGEDGFEEEVDSQSSVNALRSYQEAESFGLFGEGNNEQVGYEEPQAASVNRGGVLLHQQSPESSNSFVEDIHFLPHIQFIEHERVSLDSLNEHSEDGYPHVDFDTFDSGFGECSSPGASDSNRAEQTVSDSFPEPKSLNSNYVKQWTVCNTVQEI